MAQPQDYMDVLEDRYGFAPANSQEEVFAAQTIAEQLQKHGLATSTEEFSAPSWGQRAYAFPMILLFVGAVLLVFPAPVRLVGFFISFLSAALLAAWRFGYDLLGGMGPRAESQNIVAVRRATNVPEGERPGRTVVVVAHYDTGREDLLSKPGLSQWRARIVQLSTYAVPAVVVLSLLLLVPVIPDVGRYVIYGVTLLCALPVVIWGISEVTALTGPFTAGSVDNKTGVAAMLSVADRVVWGVPVRPTREQREEMEQRAREESQEEGKEGDLPATPSASLNIRHGEDVLRELAILPTTCDIVYVEPEPEPEPEPAPVAQDAADDELAEGEDYDAAAPEDEPDEPYDDYEGEYDEEYDEYDNEASIEQDSTWGTTDYDPSQRESGKRNLLFDLPDPAVSAVDPLSVSKAVTPARMPVDPNDFPEEDFDLSSAKDQVAPTKRRKKPVSRPSRDSFPEDDFGAPEPSEAGYDDEFDSDNFDVLDDGNISPVMSGTRREYKKAGGVLSHLFGGHKRQKEEEQSMSDWLGLDEEFDPTTDGTSMDSWEFEDDSFGFVGGSSWRGGAARNSKLRFVPAPDEDDEDFDEFESDFFDDEFDDAASHVDDIFAEEEARSARDGEDDDAYDDYDDDAYDEYDDESYDEDADAEGDQVDRELRAAITMMADEQLAEHDVWFVALGASELGHAGMVNFVEKHRSELRGAMVINLSCVGAGNLTVVTDEGLHQHRKANRRLVRTILKAAETLHVPMQRTSMVWGETDALAATKKSLRAATIMGCNPAGVPANSHTRYDIPDAVDRGMISDVVEIVCEVIRQA